ncbi:hypothetical protein [Variovorax sp. RHLX14]|uniref:hypothetical protein n=1 Tax=Variovorax sp. RHLX14 TaxID=1259731 RepID=UPI003F492BA0
MHGLKQLPEEFVISQAYELRLQALRGSTWARDMAHNYEVELRYRLKQSNDDAAPMSAKSNDFTMSTVATSVANVDRLSAEATVATRGHVATADAASDAMT